MVSFMSPGINITEIDLTTIVPTVSTTIGAIAGVFNWGPVEVATLVSSQDVLVEKFGLPDANNAETWWTASNFLNYSNKLYVSRAVSNDAYNAICGSNVVNTQIGNQRDFELWEPSANGNYLLVAKYPGAKGNSLRIGICQSGTQWSSMLQSDNVSNNTVTFKFTAGKTFANVFVTNLSGNVTHAIAQANTIRNKIAMRDILSYGGNYFLANGTFVTLKKPTTSRTAVVSTTSVSSVNTSTATFAIGLDRKNTGYVTNSSSNAWESSRLHREWQYTKYFDNIPGGTSPYVSKLGGSNDLMHVIIFDHDGAFTGVPDAVLERYPNLSRATDAKNEQGEDIHWKNVLNKSSKYVWAVNPVWGNPDQPAANTSASTDYTPLVADFNYGTDGTNETSISVGNLQTAYDVYRTPDDIAVDIILAGKARGGDDFEFITNYIIDEICENRKDCIVVASPPKDYVVNNYNDPLDKVLEWRASVNESSYVFMDSGYKYQYDKFNDKFWWVPLNGDIGGLIARTDLLRDAWWSPAGYERGDIKNVVKLAWNPDKADRDMLYINNVNPVITIANEGTILFGDKTGQTNSSAFDRINVRRLFIILEKAISQAAKTTLFNFNDEFTRATFKNMVDPYLRDIKGRRGIYDFKVVCDTTNNTGTVIDRNEFIGDIYIKPARSINFIQLNFVAVGTDVSFEEIIGQF